MSNPMPCAHFEHPYQFDNEDGITCTGCGKQVTILETLDPNERWTITNDGHGNLTIEHF